MEELELLDDDDGEVPEEDDPLDILLLLELDAEPIKKEDCSTSVIGSWRLIVT